MVQIVLILFLCIGVLFLARVIKSRNLHLWLPGLISYQFKTGKLRMSETTHVYFCLADHYEPFWNHADQVCATSRVERWLSDYPVIASKHVDSLGRNPKHTFFYPIEEYDEKIMYSLADLCKKGYGDVEVHLHHDNDTAENLEESLKNFTALLNNKHGLLRKNEDNGIIEYAFIHGNWALDNSRPDKRWCGVNNEISVLTKTGCYVDMTLPSAPGATQTKTVNRIYFAQGKQGQCKAHNTGRNVKVGEWKHTDDELLLLQGPLALNWRNRKFGIFPRIETGELSSDAPPTSDRIDLWQSCRISISGAENHIFIKTFTHGTQEKNMEMFFSGGFESLWSGLEKKFRDRKGFKLYYVTAREMYEKVYELANSRRFSKEEK